MRAIQLGLGLLSIGRTWGVANVPPPDEAAARRLIETAFDAGIRFFDTAPAYARSELILGRVLRDRLDLANNCTIATKMGEQWDAESQTSRVSHSWEDLIRSLDTSLNLLRRIDILQIHKANATNVTSDAVLAAIDYARSAGVRQFGVSVTDLETARLACESGQYAFVQLPFNSQNVAMKPVLELLQEHDIKPIVNRPFAMGAIANQAGSSPTNAFRFVRAHMTSGIVLTGTSRETHLLQNIAAFQAAVL